MILFEGQRQVQFHESDPQGFLFYAHIFKWAHDALEKYWTTHSLGWSYWFHNPEWAVPLRHCEAEFLKPMRAGSLQNVNLKVQKKGTTSVTLEFCVGTGDELLARVCTTHVFIDRKTEKPIAVPESVSKLLSF